MIVKQVDVRANIKQYFELACSGEPIIVPRKDNKNIVIISEAEYNRLQQEVDTCENNIGFFAASKNAAPLISQMQEKIEGYRKELKELEAKILKLEEESNKEEE